MTDQIVDAEAAQRKFPFIEVTEIKDVMAITEAFPKVQTTGPMVDMGHISWNP